MIEILNGGVKFNNNPHLCNVDSVLWEDIVNEGFVRFDGIEITGKNSGYFRPNNTACKYELKNKICRMLVKPIQDRPAGYNPNLF